MTARPLNPDDSPDLLDDAAPFDPRHDAAQIEGLLTRLAPGSRVLDLGCGRGRVLLPLAAAGHRVTGVDTSASALARCGAELRERGAAASLLELNFLTSWPEDGKSPDAAFDAIVCLGNTFMEVADVDVARGLLRRVASSLTPGGVFVLDDFPQEFWPEVALGNWQTGLSDDGGSQFIWLPGDAVFCLRTGGDVDPQSWSRRPGERCYRLWSMGALRLLAASAGLSGPDHLADHHLLVLTRPHG